MKGLHICALKALTVGACLLASMWTMRDEGLSLRSFLVLMLTLLLFSMYVLPSRMKRHRGDRLSCRADGYPFNNGSWRDD